MGDTELQRIHVGYIIDALGTGGTENQLKLLIDGLDRSRYRVSLYILRGIETREFEQTTVHLLGIDSIVSLEGFRSAVSLSLIMRREGVDLLQTFMQDATIIGVLAARLAGVRHVVVSIEDMLFWATPLRLAVHKMMVLLSSAIRVNSHAIKKSIGREFVFSDIHVIQNGISTKDSPLRGNTYRLRLRQQLNVGCELPIVVIVSNFNRRVKRVDLFVEAAAIQLKRRDAYFLVVGDGLLRGDIEAQIKALNCGERVLLLGQRSDVDAIYAGADLAVNTSDSEGLSNSILEGMRAGLPIVASDVPGNREVVKDRTTGWLFEPGSARSLADVFEMALGDPGARERKGRFARRMIMGSFGIDRMVEGHQKFYLELMMKVR